MVLAARARKPNLAIIETGKGLSSSHQDFASSALDWLLHSLTSVEYHNPLYHKYFWRMIDTSEMDSTLVKSVLRQLQELQQVHCLLHLAHRRITRLPLELFRMTDVHVQEEMLDALTESGELIGPVLRSKAHKEGIWHKVIHLWVINKYAHRRRLRTSLLVPYDGSSPL